ncbi:MAG TPA: SpoIIE family protein phosphatase [Candidatus Baltobacteraceae bacterium]|jgi:anti-sigma regulatory factor (Ser/Thr protein kinase)|nr:SpoIIE family protein phosphatase [Candidatus Baltobacteraceae bacterium]
MIEPGSLQRPDALDLLAQASGMLASSFDLSATLPRVADLCVRNLAHYCAIYARHPDGAISIVEAAREPGLHVHAPDATLLPDVLREHGFETVLATPLRGRNDVLGTFVLASRQHDAFDQTTEKLSGILGLLLANALDQAMLFERTHRVADRLQRALLPDTFPRVPGALFHAAYRPASAESEVGGDWYDAFSLPDGRIAISMGDVAGHGLEAATVMGEIRHSMRSAGVDQQSPAAVLQHINSVINLRKTIGMVTAVFAYYEPRTRELVYAVAGHPPPLLTIIEGFSGFLPGGGVPLGVEPNIDAQDWTFTLPSRSCTIFYTDGMTEYSRDVLAGEAQLLEAGIRSFVSDSENPALALQERIFDATANRDDAATLTLSCEDGPAAHVMRFSAIAVAAPIVRAHIQRICDAYGIPSPERFALITAVGEAVANSIEHAYRGQDCGGLTIRTEVGQQQVSVEVEDSGRWRPFEQRDERGRGIVLMHELMDHVRITSAQNGTLIKLVMARSAAS